MRDFQIVKTPNGIRGLTQADDENYRKYLAWIDALEPGEFFRLKVTPPSNAKFHRKLFAMLKLGFDHWEPEKGRKRLTYKGVPIEKSFDQFRKDIVIQAGFFTAYYDARGRAHLEAQSLSFSKCSDEKKEEIYRAIQQVLLERVLHNYTRADLDEVIEKLQGFGANNG